MIQHEKVIVVDFGSQYTQNIGRRIRELNVYSEIVPYTHFPEEALENPKLRGVILSGSPFSVHQVGSPRFPLLDKIREAGLPVLAICYGAQLVAHENQGKVVASQVREYGRAELEFINKETPLFQDINFANNVVWMSHGDSILEVNNEKFEVIARTHSVPIIAYQIKGEKTYGLQFHPEVHHSACGPQIFLNFIKRICGCSQDWTPKNFIVEAIQSLKDQVKEERVVMALSGGVDSSVAAALLQRAVGDQLFCIFVDNGLLRKDEYEQVLISYKTLGLNVKGVDAKELFYTRLAGVSDPEQKRKIIGKTFIDVFDKEAHSIQNVKFLGQGTIYPDVIESVSVKGPAVTIKSHHNVGGLPEKMNLKVVEPLRLLFKDEVRRVGKELHIPEIILHRHPFPGPGLAIRILGDITPEKVKILQQVDDIFISGLKEDGLYDQVWQAGAILLNAQSVGVMGDERTYENVVALRAVNSVDGMTADWSKLPFEFLGKISNKIINQVKGVNRVCYDISSKPPATIEWE